MAVSCAPKKDLVADNVNFADKQFRYLVDLCEASADTTLVPDSINEDGTLLCTLRDDWVSGFLPGSMWLMYEFTGDEYWKEHAIRHTENIRDMQFLKWHHDIGFMMGCSFGQGLRICNMPGYSDVLVESARSLCTRFRPVAGVIQSWNTNFDWQSKRGWMCPVIIDNMMNLELLFQASLITGDDSFRKIAISHADKTMQNHYRPDCSCYHVVDYDLETGEVRGRCTAQGFADESSWARGQAWGLYGFTMCYRFTRDQKYLDMAQKIAAFILKHPRLPEDMVPYWDYDCTDIPNTWRDASSASIMASAFYELFTFTGNGEYKAAADKMVESLSSPAYRSELGKNCGFLLTHCVTSVPHNSKIDRPLTYADYYLLEALHRKTAIEKKN